MSSVNVTHSIIQTRPTPVPESDNFNVVMTIGVPLVVMFLILLSLGMVLVYTKARRRAGATDQENPVTAISSGVPMSTSAFMGYTGQNSRIQQSQIEASTESLHSPQEQYILSSPPSYDDVMKEINMNYVAGTVHLNNSQHHGNLNPSLSVTYQEPPPQYEACDTEQSHHNNSSDNLSPDVNQQNETDHVQEVPVAESSDISHPGDEPVVRENCDMTMQNSSS